MAQKAKIFVFGMLLTLFSATNAVNAQTESNATTDDTVTTQQAEIEPAETLEATESTVPEDKGTGRAERIKAYKEKATEKLSEAKQKRITSRCVAAQGKVTSLRAKVNTAVANRKTVYQEVGDKLDTLLAKMQKAELDTTKLETAREDMRADLVLLTENLNAYDTVLADLEAMDCAADPATFQTALTSAREMQTALRAEAQEFRQFATTELKAILQDIRTQLEAVKDGGTN